MEELQLTDLFKFVDSHVHLYDMKHPTLHYGHWQPDEDLPLKELGNRNYLAQDRSDIRFAVKELSRRMAVPRRRDIEAAKRLARYLVGCPRYRPGNQANAFFQIIK